MPFSTNLPIDLPVIPEEQKFSHYDEDLALPNNSRSANLAKRNNMTTEEIVSYQQDVIEELKKENMELKERLRVVEQYFQEVARYKNLM